MLKHTVNGVEAALVPQEGVELFWATDRWLVRTPSGVRSAATAWSGDVLLVSYAGRVYEIAKPGVRATGTIHAGSGEVHSPMPGQIVEVLVRAGDLVELGQRVMVLEAMKTQQPITAPCSGVVVELGVRKGDQVAEGDLLVRVERDSEGSPD
jgi:biotin carboxyl carrier protein